MGKKLRSEDLHRFPYSFQYTPSGVNMQPFLKNGDEGHHSFSPDTRNTMIMCSLVIKIDYMV